MKTRPITSATGYDEAGDVVDEWLVALEMLGIEPATSKITDAIDRAGNLSRVAREARRDGATLRTQAINRLSRQTHEPDDIITLAATAAYSSDPDGLTNLIEIISRSAAAARFDAYRIFRKNVAAHLEALDSTIKALAEEARPLREEIPWPVRSLEQAAQLDVAPQWKRVEELQSKHSAIQELLHSWLRDGMLTPSVRQHGYTTGMLMYADFSKTLELDGLSAAQRFLVNLDHGPHVVGTDQVPDEWIELHRRHLDEPPATAQSRARARHAEEQEALARLVPTKNSRPRLRSR